MQAAKDFHKELERIGEIHRELEGTIKKYRRDIERGLKRLKMTIGKRISLINHLKLKFPHIIETIVDEPNELDPFSSDFIHFLQETQVQHESNLNSINLQLSETLFKEMSHLEFIDYLMKGFESLKDNPTGLGKSVMFDFRSNQLKTVMWARLSHRMGRKEFASLLNGLAAIYLPHLGLVNVKWKRFGRHNNQQKPTLVERRRMFYQTRHDSPAYKVLLRLPEVVLSRITAINVSPGKVPKKLRKLYHVLVNAKERESTMNYKHLQRGIMTHKPLSSQVFDNCTHIGEVTKFIMTSTYRMFPEEVFGPPGNQTKLSNAIVSFLTCPRYEKFDVEALVTSLNITGITWLGKTSKITSIQDLLLRKRLLGGFLTFLFAFVISNLARTFWYITDNPLPQGSCNLFFPRNKWTALTKNWLEDYQNRYLCLIEGPSVVDDSGLNGISNFGILRLLPKKSDLRPLCIPSREPLNPYASLVNSKDSPKNPKDSPKNSRSFHDPIRPIRDLIRNQQARYKQAFPKSSVGYFSAADVGRAILQFRKDLLECNALMPPVYGVQFDMKHCYDNLSQIKIISCLEKLYSIDSPQEEYFLRNVLAFSSDGKRYRRNFNLVTRRQNIEELDLFRNANLASKSGVFSDNSRLLKFTMGDILDLVRTQVIDSSVQIPDNGYRFYKRTRGVFQGFPLLATLCDIVYNSLVDEVILSNRARFNQEKSMFARLADDFIFFSTSKQDCEQLFRNANSSLAKEFGAYVNMEKLIIFDPNDSNSHTNFLGIRINTKTLLTEQGNVSRVKIPKAAQRSLQASLKYILGYLAQHLPDYLLDLDLCPIESALENLRCLIRPVHDAVITVRKQFKTEPLLLEMLERSRCEFSLCIAEKWLKLNGGSIHDDQFFNHMDSLMDDLFHKMVV